jgi:hypothetical protein
MKQLSWMKHCILAAGLACGVGNASAEIVTLTFDNIRVGVIRPNAYRESGFFINSLSDASPTLHGADDMLWLNSGAGSSPYQISREDGGTFDFVGFSYAGGDALFVSDTGATFTILGDQPMASFTLPDSFKNVSYINWYMTSTGDVMQWGKIDNVAMNIAAVPEPAHTAMLGLGLAALAVRRRSGRRQAKFTA